jgi:MFS family permease
MASLLKPIKFLYNEFGIASVYNTGRDAWLIILARACRMFAYGGISLILALFFSALEFTDFYIGLFMTLTLLGDLLLSLGLTLVADGLGRRRVLFLGAFLMMLSGATFALFDNFWILLFAAVVGVVSATGSDFGPFRAIEESTLSHLTTPKTRSDVLAWYVTSASLGSSLGTELCGRIVDALQKRKYWRHTDAYHAVFWVYVLMGGMNIIFCLLLSDSCEITKSPDAEKSEETSEMLLDDRASQDGDNDDGLDGLSSSATSDSQMPPKKTSLFAQISSPTLSIMYKLWFLLVIDSLADGMVGYSLTTYFLDQKFHLSKSVLGDITSVSYLLSSLSTVFAAPLANRLGLINTMVFTHLPSSAAVLFFPFPHSILLTVAFFFLRTGLNNMDQAPRSAFIAAVVKPEERTAVMGITSMLRTLAATTGPSVTGLLAGHGRFWVAFVAAGSLRITYDLGLWAMFINMKLFQHETVEGLDDKGDERRQGDEEELREIAK